MQINRDIIPAFYRLLEEHDASRQITYASEFTIELDRLVNAASHTGPFFLGLTMSYVDVQIAPWLLRIRRLLTPFRGWPDPEPGSRLAKWIAAVEAEDCVKATTSDDNLYLETFERHLGKSSLLHLKTPLLIGALRRQSSQSCADWTRQRSSQRTLLTVVLVHSGYHICLCPQDTQSYHRS